MRCQQLYERVSTWKTIHFCFFFLADNLIVTTVGMGDLNPSFPHKGEQVIPLRLGSKP